ncbi:pyruvate kinase [Candidatus Gracilibacteria bacterium]|nr:pyruvate kinase [Candidatus Gracilibacteria bacterium]
MNTKILATVGPASLEKIKKLQEKGASRFRLNLSHGDVDFHKNAIRKIKEIGNPNEVVLDTKGPDIRTGDTDGEIKILKGEEYFLIFSDKKEKIFSDDKKIFHGFKKFSETVEIGDKIIIDDGKIVLTVSEKGENLKAIAKNSGTITSRRHINLPGKHIDLPILTKSDEEILKMGISEGIDAVAVSFVRNKEDILEVRKIVGQNIKIIAKIENLEGLQNIDEIIGFSDEIMVARGDLGIKVHFYQLPLVQKSIVKKCNRTLTPVIIATQMLMSMTENTTPTRAEVFDVSSAVSMGANTVMLSDETASGRHPEKAVNVMRKICEFAEKSEDFFLEID